MDDQRRGPGCRVDPRTHRQGPRLAQPAGCRRRAEAADLRNQRRFRRSGWQGALHQGMRIGLQDKATDHRHCAGAWDVAMKLPPRRSAPSLGAVLLAVGCLAARIAAAADNVLTPDDYAAIQQLDARYAFAIETCTNNGYDY